MAANSCHSLYRADPRRCGIALRDVAAVGDGVVDPIICVAALPRPGVFGTIPTTPATTSRAYELKFGGPPGKTDARTPSGSLGLFCARRELTCGALAWKYLLAGGLKGAA